MTDNDLIQRGDALKIALGLATAESAEKAHHAIAALPAVTVDTAALLKDVPRHSLDFCDRMEIDKDGVWMHEDHVLAALEPVAAPRRYMGQIMAECDCSRQSECEAAQKCLAEQSDHDPAAIREAALREVLDILESHGAAGEAIAFEVAALIPKKGYDAPREAALLADLAQGPMRGELMEPWIRRMMNRAAALISKGAADDR